MTIVATSFIVSRWLKKSLSKKRNEAILLLGHSTRAGTTIQTNVAGASVFDIIKQG